MRVSVATSAAAARARERMLIFYSRCRHLGDETLETRDQSAAPQDRWSGPFHTSRDPRCEGRHDDFVRRSIHFGFRDWCQCRFKVAQPGLSV